MAITRTSPITNEEDWQRVNAQREKDDPAQDPTWRILEPIGTRKQVNLALRMMAEKDLTTADVVLLLVTLRVYSGQNIATLLPPHLVPEQFRKQDVNDEKSTQEATGQS